MILFKKLPLFFVVMLLGLTMPRLACAASEKNNEHQAACQQCLETHYTTARDSIVRTWTVLDTMRSISIAPKDRVAFAQRMFNDVMMTLSTLSGLATSCQFCARYYENNVEDIAYLEEILGYMMEAFEAVFTPIVNGEEKLLRVAMENIITQMHAIRQGLSSIAKL